MMFSCCSSASSEVELLLRHGVNSWRVFGNWVRNLLKWNGGMLFGIMEKVVGNEDELSEAR